MGTEEKMTVDERYKYLRKMHQRYQQGNRTERARLLDEMVAVTGLHRKYLCTLMNKPVGPARRTRTRQRSRVYRAKVDDALRVIGETLDWVCAQRMTPALLETARLLAHHGELSLDDELEDLLGSISISTTERCLARIRQDQYCLPRRHGRSPAPQSLLAQIPAGRIPWNIPDPGYFEVDTVVHSGSDARGEVVCSLQMIDVYSGWSERHAMLGRSEVRAQEAFAHIVGRCPIPIRQLHPDNGPEFMNHHLVRYFRERVRGVQLTRSRPWQRNDNRFVEQKNATLIRAYLGDLRLDTQSQCQALNGLYEQMWCYYNFYQPVLRQVAKELTWDERQIPHVHRRHDQARTPLQRLLASNVLTREQVDALQARYLATNPRVLRAQIYERLELLYASAR
jgi:hypothetical protein